MRKLISPTDDWGPSHPEDVHMGGEIDMTPVEPPPSYPEDKAGYPGDMGGVENQGYQGEVNGNVAATTKM